MSENIRLLEERVARVVSRLRLLAAERRELEDELRSLRDRATDPGSAPGEEADGAGWKRRRDQAVGLIRKTLDELREH